MNIMALVPTETAVALPGLTISFSSIGIVIAAIVLIPLILTAIAMINPRTRAKLMAGKSQADTWLIGAIDRWHSDGRLSDAEANRLRSDLAEPQFQAVVPHFGAHLTISVFLRFPLGSIARAGYTSGNALLATGRLLTRRIDRAMWHRLIDIHSPLVLLFAAIPGFGAFAYLAAKPVRAHHLLLRVALDDAMQKVPWHLYERSGLRAVVARRTRLNDNAPPHPTRLVWRSNRISRALFGIVTLLLVGDLVIQTIDFTLKPTFFGWSYLFRLFDLDNEASFGNWFAVVSIFVCAIILGAIAFAKSEAGDRFARHWLALALLALALSIDEQAKLHDPGGGIGDRIRERFDFDGVLYYGWAFFAMASAIAVLVIFRHFIRALPAATRNSAILAAMFYIGGEAGVEVIDGWWLDAHGQDFVYRIMTCFEEYFGLLGVVVALSALLFYIREHYGEVLIDLRGTARNSAPDPVPRPVTTTRPTILIIPKRGMGTEHVGTAASEMRSVPRTSFPNKKGMQN